MTTNILCGQLIIITDIDERKKSENALKENQRTFETLISNLPGVAYKCKNDPQWTMEFVSEGCLELTGYQPEDLILNKISYGDLIHPDDRQKVWDTVQKALKENKPFKLVYRITTANLMDKFVWNQGRGIFSPKRKLLALEGFITDITDSKIAEEELRKSLREKNILLQEIHHRVKNNMQIISSLLSLQSRCVGDEGTLNVLKESQDRIKAMALVHEKLYQSDSLARVNFADYIKSLINELCSSYHINTELIKSNINVEDVFLDINMAIPCGLIINELISNILKHAFPAAYISEPANDPFAIKGKKGNIYTEFSRKDNKYTLIVRDDGIGLPYLDFNNTKTLGLQLVSALVNQLGGTIEINRNNGTEFIINFYDQDLKQ